MKTIFTIIVPFLFLLFPSCGIDNGKTPSSVQAYSLVIVVYDISLSNDTYAVIQEEHLVKIFDRMAFRGGGKFYALHIKTNSSNQDIIEYVIPAFDTLQLIGNPYQIKNRREKNQTILNDYTVERQKFVSSTSSKIIVPKNETFTDIKNAIQMAKITLEQRNYANWHKHLLIISDGINDLPPVNGVDPIDPIELNNVNIIMVRATKSDYISGNKPLLTNSINDGIDNL